MTEALQTPRVGVAKITIICGKLNVPNSPIIAFIEDDGAGAHINDQNLVIC